MKESELVAVSNQAQVRAALQIIQLLVPDEAGSTGPTKAECADVLQRLELWVSRIGNAVRTREG